MQLKMVITSVKDKASGVGNPISSFMLRGEIAVPC